MSFASRPPTPPVSVSQVFMPPRARHLSTTSTGLRRTESRESLLSRKEEASDKEINIQVVLRCRGRNERELRENSPAIVETTPLRKEVKTPQKTYTFDRVFGPEASQELIYDEVVQPILDEVLLGYNCTIFAYGQTGTGKTYTMEGDLEETGEGTPSGDSGIIPRTLHQLFTSLEATSTEYSVRVSSIELYNEELNDLLTPEIDTKKLKIFEDTKGKGVLIQGLEEVLVNNAVDGVRVLQQGSRMRRIAATKCNEKSSRSHCVYTLTVHIKEATPDGEDLLKVGKLNLVDLAGSENIQRSGAENKRAREAGMINQSLLTLGRVINALVEHSPHIPYRESKLTRLLQDSLGGRTKTCIIATISPAKANLEETISTLEYASRAKNIRNKPEINQRMTKKALIKEYISEIERLKSDLNATRDKNGVYLSNDSYAKLTQESSSNRNLVDEERKRIQSLEEEISRVNAKFQQNIKMLSDVRLKLEWTTVGRLQRKRLSRLPRRSRLNVRFDFLKQSELNKTTENLQKTQSALDSANNDLVEQKMLRKAHTWTELKLDGMANGLVGTLKESVTDVDDLFESLDRKRNIESKNTTVFSEFQQTLLAKASELDSHVSQFRGMMGGFADSMHGKMTEFSQVKEKELVDAHNYIDARLQQLLVDKSSLGLVMKDHGDSFAAFRDHITQLRVELSEMMIRRHVESQQFVVKMFGQLRQEMEDYYGEMHAHHRTLKNSLGDLVASVQTHLDSQTESVRHMGNVTSKAVESESVRVQNQTEYITTLINQERTNATHLKDELLGSISSLLNSFAANQDQSLRNVMAVTQKSLNENLEVMTKLGEEHRGLEDGLVGKYGEAKEVVVKGADDLGAEMEQYLKTAHQQLESMHANNENVKKRVFEDMEESNALAQKCTKRVGEVTAQASDQYKAIEQRHSQTVSTLTSNAQEGFGRLNTFVSKLNEDIQGHTAAMKDSVVLTRNTTETFYEAVREELEQTRAEISMPDRLKIDDSAMPSRRSYKFPRKWNLTRRHDDLLQEFRERGNVCQSFDSEEPEEIITVNSTLSSAMPTPSTSASSVHSFLSVDGVDGAAAIPLPPSPLLGAQLLDDAQKLPPTFLSPVMVQSLDPNSRLPRYSRPKRLKPSKDIENNRTPFSNLSNSRLG